MAQYFINGTREQSLTDASLANSGSDFHKDYWPIAILLHGLRAAKSWGLTESCPK